MADVYRREEGMANIQANLKKHAMQRKPLKECTNEELKTILDQQMQIYSNVNLRNSLPDKGKKIEQKIEEIKHLLGASSNSSSPTKAVPSSEHPFEPDLTIVEKDEDMSLNDTSKTSIDTDLETIHNKLHFMTIKDKELQSRDPKKEELSQIIHKGRLGISYEQKHNKVGRKISLLPLEESISLTEKDFEENKRERMQISTESSMQQQASITEHFEEDEDLLEEDIIDLGEQDQW